MSQSDRSSAVRVRLVDVARAAGVSKTTVSDALNGAGRLPAATREHVRQVARRLGYRPNATARLLRAGHTRLIGFAAREYVETPWVYAELAYFGQLVTAATRAALTHGYGVVLLPTSGPDDCWLDMPLDGVFVVDPVEGDPMVGDFLAAGIPVVSDRRALAEATGGAGTVGRWIDFDHGGAVRRVLDHLEAAGAERIAVVAGATTACFHQESAAAYRDWCAERGREPSIVCLPGPGLQPTLEAVEELLDGPAPPDALFILVEVNPPLLLEAVRRCGRSVPDDLLLVCTTEDPTALHTDPPISTLSFLPGETAEAAVELLVDSVEGRAGEPGRLFSAELRIRASSAFPATA
ncbi:MULTISPECIES: LacI family DNA-binding transcriptional regulator [Streptosporangium]|uniref:DNA-binding LacI/PurR family transcriptional regulator n=1 Tax=Streptosporangium brasiliense TaxID=47480 RepID=A0ABT9RD60_9ACTN|nr:LacI family DNA-binding transcriptional regulator [Streptosporangium brasiliense]MDP9867196.1 DNA-binding LacI/PurR family transcriptional regulator [Streptosporangium brasiliense]